MAQAKITVFAHDATFLDQINTLRGVEVFSRSKNGQKQLFKQLREAKNIFFLVASPDLPKVSELVQDVNKRHHLRGLFIREEDPRWLPQMFNRADLRTLKKTFVHSGPELPRRVLKAWLMGAQHQLIANARIVNNQLLVVSCAAESIEVPLDSLPELSKLNRIKSQHFKLADDGSKLSWPEIDVHLDIERIRYVTDEDFRLRLDARHIQHDKRFGFAVAVLRKLRGLRQSDIPGLSARQVRRIERGDRATLEALRKLSEAHNLKLDDYLNQIAGIAAEQLST